MSGNIYKFEKYPDRNFPVYSSIQQNKELLVAPHFHGDMEFILIQSGSVTVSAGPEKYHCHNNEIIYISPQTVHTAVSDTTGSSLCGFVFHPSLLKPYLSESNLSILPVCGKSMLYSKESSYYEKLSETLKNTIAIYNDKPSTYRLDMTANILLLLSLLLNSGAVFNCKKNNLYCQIKPAIEYIEKNYNQIIRVSDLSRLVNVCDDHFIRMFKATTSRTPTAYITDVRLHQALKLLSMHQYSVSEISELTGFSGIQYFSRIFKERIGISPSEYARIHTSVLRSPLDNDAL